MAGCTDSRRSKTADLLNIKEEKVSKYLDSLQLYEDVDLSKEQGLSEHLKKFNNQLDTADIYRLEDFQMSLRLLRKANERINGTIEEGTLTKKQLSSLEKDIRNGFFSEEEYEEYAAIEDSAAVMFISSASELFGLYQRNISTLETTKPIADSLVGSLVRRGYR